MARRRGNVDLTVVAFDTKTWQEVHRTVLPAPRVESPQLTARGSLIYVLLPERASDPAEIQSLNPLTGDIRTLYASSRLVAYPIALSKDGTMLAFAETAAGVAAAPSDVRVLDVVSGQARTIRTFTGQDPPGFTGQPVPMAWRDDNRGFVVAGANPGPPGTWATVLLDGAVSQYGLDSMYVAPGSRIAATGGFGDLACTAVDLPQRLALIDLDANKVVNSVEDPHRGIRQRTWSPAGDELLYQQLSPEEVRADCNRTGSMPEPLGKAFLLAVAGGPPTAVDDVAALRRQWYGDRIIDFECGGETAFNPYGDCVSDAGTGHMFLNGEEVTSGEVLRAIGFIEPRQ